MSQNVVNYGIDPSGAQLLDELLSGEQQNRLTMDGGNSRPSYAEIGTVWTDKSVEGKATLKRFNGTSDNALMTIDETTSAITIPGIADTDLSNLSTTGKHYVAFKGYDVAETYSINDIVVNVDADNEVKIYQSLADDNTSALTDGTKWKEVSLGGGGGGVEIGDMGFAPLGIDESLNLRRYLNGQVISQTQFVSFTTKVKSAVALFPSLATDEATWQAEKTLSKFGQVGKFVIDDVAQTIRLPAVVNAQGLLGLSGIGNLVSESLPNISGEFRVYSNNADPNVENASGAFGFNEKASQSAKYVNASPATSTFQPMYVDFNASRSSSTYQDNAPVQQEAVQYPYYIQVATGVEETLPAIREYKTNVPYVLGDSKYFEANPYNASWLESNGQYNASSVYPDFWTQLTGVELNASLNVGDTIEIGGKSYVKRGLPVVLSTDTITDYDFVVNQDDQTFRLPLKTKLASGSAVVGNGMTLGLTDGTNNFSIYTENSTLDIGKNSYGQSVGSARVISGVSNYINSGVTTDPSKSGIETSSNGLKLYYYVGDTVQDASLINAGAILNTLSGKIGYDDLTTVHCVVETYQSGNSWYRVYDDGWVEQGGIIEQLPDIWTIEFLKPFADSSYMLQGEQWGTDATGNLGILTQSGTSASGNHTGSSTIKVTWFACGYGA